MDAQLRAEIVRALRELWPARRGGYPKSGEVLDKMVEQGAQAPPPRAMLQELEEMEAEGLMTLSEAQALDAEARRAHGATAVTWVDPALLQ